MTRQNEFLRFLAEGHHRRIVRIGGDGENLLREGCSLLRVAGLQGEFHLEIERHDPAGNHQVGILEGRLRRFVLPHGLLAKARHVIEHRVGGNARTLLQYPDALPIPAVPVQGVAVFVQIAVIKSHQGIVRRQLLRHPAERIPHLGEPPHPDLPFRLMDPDPVSCRQGKGYRDQNKKPHVHSTEPFLPPGDHRRHSKEREQDASEGRQAQRKRGECKYRQRQHSVSGHRRRLHQSGRRKNGDNERQYEAGDTALHTHLQVLVKSILRASGRPFFERAPLPGREIIVLHPPIGPQLVAHPDAQWMVKDRPALHPPDMDATQGRPLLERPRSNQQDHRGDTRQGTSSP